MTLTRPRARLTLAAVIIGLLGVPAIAQNGAQFKDWNSAVLAETANISPKTPCAALIALTGYEFSIVSAVSVPESAEAPVHCRVSGLIPPEIRFEVSLPSPWNGRLYMFGNGGYAGEALDAPARVASTRRALSRGFATAQNNTGHDASREPLGSFASDPQKFVDYAFRAVHVTAVTAKRILQAYYDGALRHSYFDGCSTGGRQGLISAQRFPDDFDGIVVGAPVLDFAGTMISYAVIQRALAAAPIPAPKLKTLSEVVYAKCDAVDGLKDGLIDDPRQCRFDPAADLPRCAADADGEACFTDGQLRAIDAIYRGVPRGNELVFPGWPLGGEAGWTPWFVSAQAPQPVQTAFGETFFKNMAFGRPNASYDWKTFNVDTDLDKLQAARSALDATDPDLSRFKTRGGKIVSYYGWADPALNPLMGVRYYESVIKRMGPPVDFYRLFMVPGMFHCGGGVGPSTFDAFTPLVQWVEKGVAPASIVASRVVDGKVVRTRPLCPYPQVAKRQEGGNVDEAAGFTCAAPERAPSSRP